MTDNTVRGRFVWHELMTSDTAGAHAFYSKVLGWKKQAWEQDPSYSMFAAPSGPLGGTVAVREGAPNWLPYVGTPDIDATVRQATGLGGSVKKAPTAIANAGKYAVLTDPQGATFAVHWSTSEAPPEGPAKRGEFSWHELATTDNGAAFTFYSALFGWDKMGEFDMGPMGVYLIFGRNGMQLGGMFNKGDVGPPGPPYWLGYVRVKDVHDIVNKVKAAGGSLVNGPMEVPGGDWIAQFVDVRGALFAVHALAADVKSAKQASAAAEPAKPAAPRKAKSAAKKKAKKKKPARKKKRAAAKRPKKKKKKKAKRSARDSAKASRRKAAKRGGTKKRVRKTRKRKSKRG